MDVKTSTGNEARSGLPRAYRVGKVNITWDKSSGFHCLLVTLSTTLGFRGTSMLRWQAPTSISS